MQYGRVLALVMETTGKISWTLLVFRNGWTGFYIRIVNSTQKLSARVVINQAMAAMVA